MTPKNVQLVIRPDAAGAAEACSEFVAQQLNHAIGERGRAMIAISGGSSPKPLFALLAAKPVDWARVHVFWVDERCVPADDAASNFRMAKYALLDPAGIPPANVHRVMTELEPKAAAEQYAAAILEILGPECRFDLIHRGIGPDAHTASLFPGDPLLGQAAILQPASLQPANVLSASQAAAVWVPKFSQWRVTLTPAILRQARATAVFAPGADKADAVARILEGEVAPLEAPAQITTRFGTEETWFLDAAAASRITRA